MVSFSGSNYNSHFIKFGTRAEQAQTTPTNGWERGLSYDEEEARRKTRLSALIEQHKGDSDAILMRRANWELNHWRFAPLTESNIRAARSASLISPAPKLEEKPVTLESDSEDEKLKPSRSKRKKAVVDSEDEDEFPVKRQAKAVNKPTNPFLNEDSDSELPKASSGRLKRGRRKSTPPSPSIKKDELVPPDAKTIVPHRTYVMLTGTQQDSYDNFIRAIDERNRQVIKEILAAHPSFLQQPDSAGVPPVIPVIQSSQPQLLREFLEHVTLQNVKAGKYTPPMWPEIKASLGHDGIRQFIDTHKVLLEYHQENPGHLNYGTIADGKYATDYIDKAVNKSRLNLTVNERKDIAKLKRQMQEAQSSSLF